MRNNEQMAATEMNRERSALTVLLVSLLIYAILFLSVIIFGPLTLKWFATNIIGPVVIEFAVFIFALRIKTNNDLLAFYLKTALLYFPSCAASLFQIVQMHKIYIALTVIHMIVAGLLSLQNIYILRKTKSEKFMPIATISLAGRKNELIAYPVLMLCVLVPLLLFIRGGLSILPLAFIFIFSWATIIISQSLVFAVILMRLRRGE